VIATREGYDGELGNFAIALKRTYPTSSGYTNKNVKIWGTENTRYVNLIAIGY